VRLVKNILDPLCTYGHIFHNSVDWALLEIYKDILGHTCVHLALRRICSDIFHEFVYWALSLIYRHVCHGRVYQAFWCTYMVMLFVIHECVCWAFRGYIVIVFVIIV